MRINSNYIFTSALVMFGSTCLTLLIDLYTLDTLPQRVFVFGCLCAISALCVFLKLYAPALVPILCVAMIELISNSDIVNLSLSGWILNVFIWGIIAVILVNLLDYKKIGWYFTVVLAFIFGVINHFVIKYKMFALMPADVLNVGAALEIIPDYQYDIDGPILRGLILLIFAILLIRWFLPEKAPSRNMLLLHKGVALVGILSLFFWIDTVDFCTAYRITQDPWNSATTYSRHGFTASFISYTQTMRLQPPDGYSEERAQQILSRYSTSDDTSTQDGPSEAKPTIIVIMNESFSDFRCFGSLGKTENVMWFMDNFNDCLEKGFVYTSVRGGGTCNSEFEFLTGNSLAFFEDIFPYTMFDFDNVPTIVSTLKSEGYRTVAMHPANAINYRRATVYHQLGFDKFYSLDDYSEYEKLFLDRTSDLDDYKKLIEVVESTDEPQFIFNVTFQNHGYYIMDTLERDLPIVNVDPAYESYDDVKMYLSLMNESNRALEYLIQYFRSYDRPVIICFFGDHQPSCLNRDFEKQIALNSPPKSEMEQLQQMYKTPYFIWANYDIPANNTESTTAAPETSLNYLGSTMLKYAGIQGTQYNSFLSDMSQQIPVFNRYGYRLIDGNWMKHDNLDTDLHWLNEYNILQYYNMFSEGS